MEKSEIKNKMIQMLEQAILNIENYRSKDNFTAKEHWWSKADQIRECLYFTDLITKEESDEYFKRSNL